MKYLGKITDNKDLVTKEYVDNADATKQATLVSGTNIKTINNNSILGSGNISISGSGVTPSFSGLANNKGSVVLGDLVIEWGVESITSGSSGGTAGGVTLYLGQTNVTFANTFAYYPSISLTWSGNYVNQVAVYATNSSTTGFTVMGRMLTANSTRSVRWLAIGKKA